MKLGVRQLRWVINSIIIIYSCCGSDGIVFCLSRGRRRIITIVTRQYFPGHRCLPTLADVGHTLACIYNYAFMQCTYNYYNKLNIKHSSRVRHICILNAFETMFLPRHRLYRSHIPIGVLCKFP